MRNRQAKIRPFAPDPLYRSATVAKFINLVQERGKKSVARKIVYRAFELIRQAGEDPLEVFEAALKNVGPLVEVKSRRIGGANYQIPVEVSRRRRQALAMRWIRDAARIQQGKPMFKFLAAEFLTAKKNEGSAIKKRDDVHKQAEANRAFAHFARF